MNCSDSDLDSIIKEERDLVLLIKNTLPTIHNESKDISCNDEAVLGRIAEVIIPLAWILCCFLPPCYYAKQEIESCNKRCFAIINSRFKSSIDTLQQRYRLFCNRKDYPLGKIYTSTWFESLESNKPYVHETCGTCICEDPEFRKEIEPTVEGLGRYWSNMMNINKV
jgi:hypothetical protein